MTRTLGEVASVRTATIFREAAPKEAENGNVRALAIKDIVTGWPIEFNSLPLIRVEQNLLSNCLRGGEVLIPSRGDYYPARYVADDLPNVFPFGQINVIEPYSGISGPYLAWFLNQPRTQQLIAQQLTGSNIKALNKQSLLTLPVQLPSMEVQQMIAHLQERWALKKALQERLLTVEGTEIEAICRKLSTGVLRVP